MNRLARIVALPAVLLTALAATTPDVNEQIATIMAKAGCNTLGDSTSIAANCPTAARDLLQFADTLSDPRARYEATLAAAMTYAKAADTRRPGSKQWRGQSCATAKRIVNDPNASAVENQVAKTLAKCR